jgi:hypothetical protein
MTLHFLKMTAEKYYEYDLLLLPGIYQVNLIDPGFYSGFITRISIFKFHCHIFFIYYTILPSPQTITVRYLPNTPRRLQ